MPLGTALKSFKKARTSRGSRTSNITICLSARPELTVQLPRVESAKLRKVLTHGKGQPGGKGQPQNAN